LLEDRALIPHIIGHETDIEDGTTVGYIVIQLFRSILVPSSLCCDVESDEEKAGGSGGWRDVTKWIKEAWLGECIDKQESTQVYSQDACRQTDRQARR
jgi:hypothetical protein